MTLRVKYGDKSKKQHLGYGLNDLVFCVWICNVLFKINVAIMHYTFQS